MLLSPPCGRRFACLLSCLLLGWLTAVPAPARAQSDEPIHPSYHYHHGPTPRWVGHFTVLSANAVLGGLTGGTLRWLRGGSFREGVVGGAAGGVGVYAGKLIAVQRWDGAGLVGRQVAAVGSSVSRNAGEGRAALEQLSLPLGPVRVHLRLVGAAPVRATVDLHSLFWMGYAVAEPALHFDAGASLSAGAPVFRAPDHRMIWRPGPFEAWGFAPAGNIYLADVPAMPETVRSEVFAHERVHVLQHDQLKHQVGDPLEDWLLSRLPGGRTVSRYVDLNVVVWLPAYLGQRSLLYEHQPWEIEADFLAGAR